MNGDMMDKLLYGGDELVILLLIVAYHLENTRIKTITAFINRHELSGFPVP